MKKTINLPLVLAAAMAICFALVSDGKAAGTDSKKTIQTPIWQITQDGTADPVEWIDADNLRFAIYDAGTPTDETDDAVLDKETGLVWRRYVHIDDRVDFDTAFYECRYGYWGNRKGWRVPSLEELGSLVDMQGDQPPDYDGEEPEKMLPMGHPFIIDDVQMWSSNSRSADPTRAWLQLFLDGTVITRPKSGHHSALCVRGGQGNDAAY